MKVLQPWATQIKVDSVIIPVTEAKFSIDINRDRFWAVIEADTNESYLDEEQFKCLHSETDTSHRVDLILNFLRKSDGGISAVIGEGTVQISLQAEMIVEISEEEDKGVGNRDITFRTEGNAILQLGAIQMGADDEGVD